MQMEKSNEVIELFPQLETEGSEMNACDTCGHVGSEYNLKIKGPNDTVILEKNLCGECAEKTSVEID